jgi:hypothetical protein
VDCCQPSPCAHPTTATPESSRALGLLKAANVKLARLSACEGYGEPGAVTVGEAVARTLQAASCRAIECTPVGLDTDLCAVVAKRGDEGGFNYRVVFEVRKGKLVVSSIVCSAAG